MKKIGENPKDYVSNNIDFRIVSSKLLERYKSSQNFVLSEMKYGQYPFSSTSRELAILYTDNVFKALLDIECLSIRSHQLELSIVLAKKFISLLLSRTEYLHSVANYHGDIFDPGYIKLWDKVHLQIARMVERVIENSIGDELGLAFSSVASILIDSIDAVRFELYEVDYLLGGGKSPFLAVTNMCSMVSRELGENRIRSRAEAYQEFFDRKIDFIARDYTDSVSSFDVCVSDATREGISILDKNGVPYGTE